MPNENYAVITAANCPAENRSEALSKMPELAAISKQAGASRVSFGMTLSGINPGALVYIQFFENLNGFEKVMNSFSSSDLYQDLVQNHAVSPYVRNVITMKQVPYEPKLDPRPNYLVLSKGERVSLSESEVLSLLGTTASVFSANGAQTLRFGQIITGTDPGQYLLGVTYPSMKAIEDTYTSLSKNANFVKLSTGISINMRSIIQLHGMV